MNCQGDHNHYHDDNDEEDHGDDHEDCSCHAKEETMKCSGNTDDRKFYKDTGDDQDDDDDDDSEDNVDDEICQVWWASLWDWLQRDVGQQVKLYTNSSASKL